MLIPFLRKIPLLGMVMSLLIAGNSLAQPDFAPFPNFSPHGWAGVTVAAAWTCRFCSNTIIPKPS